MIKYLMAHDAVSQPVAVRRLELQARAGAIVGRLGAALGSRWGNSWFDRSTGTFDVGVVGGPAQASPARPYLESQGIANETAFVPVRSSAAELNAAKARLNTKLGALISQSAATTGIDAEEDEIVLALASNLPVAQIAEVEAEAKAESVKVEVVPTPPEELISEPLSCQNRPWRGANLLACAKPLRGGVGLMDLSTNVLCSLGFIVTDNTKEYVMTAGHCGARQTGHSWQAGSSNFQESLGNYQFIGNEMNYYVGSEGDVGFITINTASSPWFPVSNPSEVASLNPQGYWGSNENQYLENIAWSSQNGVACFTGTRSDTQCGEIRLLGQTQDIGEGYGVVNHLVLTTMCADHGDSGGTVWGNHSGLGMVESRILGGNPACGGYYTYYTEAIQDLWYTGKGRIKFYVPPYGETY